jgi:hypothetical protein
MFNPFYQLKTSGMSQHLHMLFCLNKAKQNQQQLCPLIIRLTWKKQRKQVATGFQLSVRDWGKIERGGPCNR